MFPGAGYTEVSLPDSSGWAPVSTVLRTQVWFTIPLLPHHIPTYRVSHSGLHSPDAHT